MSHLNDVNHGCRCQLDDVRAAVFDDQEDLLVLC